MTQPEALRLADWLEDQYDPTHNQAQAAAFLRQLHEANEAFGKRQEWWNERMFVLEQQRDALLEALKLMLEQFTKTPSTLKDSEARIKAHAAIAQTEGQ